MVKHTQKIRRLLPMNCLSVFDHFVGLAVKGLKMSHFLYENINSPRIKQLPRVGTSTSFEKRILLTGLSSFHINKL